MPATEIAESALAEMEARASAVTPEPWFIAHARTDIPALVAEVRRLSRLSLYDPRTHVCVPRAYFDAELSTPESK